MSNGSLSDRLDEFSHLNLDGKALRHGIVSSRWLANSLSGLAFWSAIALPALYLPLLFAGLENVNDLLVFLGLFALHVVALVGGQSYRRG